MSVQYNRQLGLALLLLVGLDAKASAETIRVYAAASLQPVLTVINQRYQQRYPTQVMRVSFGGSSTLARQLEAGAPADLFLSADQDWMNYLAERGRIQLASRQDWLRNQLVLIAPQEQAQVPAVQWQRQYRFAQAFQGRLCLAEPNGVPAGRYARQALVNLGWWPTVQNRLAPAADVRAALTLVEKGACTLGLVYATDARSSRRVKMVSVVPDNLHLPIRYAFAQLPQASPASTRYLEFLKSNEAKAAFAQAGFRF